MERFPRKQQGFDWSALVAALAVLVIGIIILIWPAASSRVLVYVIAGAIGITGLIRIVLYLAHREDFRPFSFGGLATGEPSPFGNLRAVLLMICFYCRTV